MKILLKLLLLICAIVIFNIVSLLAILVQIPRKALRKESLEKYFYSLAISEDQRGGSYLYGTEDFTISSYTYYLHTKGNKYATYFMRFIDSFALLLGDKEHCKNAFEKELEEFKNVVDEFATKSN